jgi:hypothetical protein
MLSEALYSKRVEKSFDATDSPKLNENPEDFSPTNSIKELEEMNALTESPAIQ